MTAAGGFPSARTRRCRGPRLRQLGNSNGAGRHSAFTAPSGVIKAPGSQARLSRAHVRDGAKHCCPCHALAGLRFVMTMMPVEAAARRIGTVVKAETGEVTAATAAPLGRATASTPREGQSDAVAAALPDHLCGAPHRILEQRGRAPPSPWRHAVGGRASPPSSRAAATPQGGPPRRELLPRRRLLPATANLLPPRPSNESLLRKASSKS